MVCILFPLNFLLYAKFCVPLFTTWRYNNNLFTRYSLLHNYSLFFLHFCTRKHYQLFSRSLQRRSSNHYNFLHVQRDFTQGWLNSYYLSCALSCSFIVIHKHANERSWSRMFVCSFARELYSNYIIVGILYSLSNCCCWFTCTQAPCICLRSCWSSFRLMLNYGSPFPFL